MNNIEKMLLDYGFGNFDDLSDTLRHGSQDGIFFENAMAFVDNIITMCEKLEQENKELRQENEKLTDDYDRLMSLNE